MKDFEGAIEDIKKAIYFNPQDTSNYFVISNYQYEDSLQEKKRQIRLIQPRYVNEFVKEFESKLNG